MRLTLQTDFALRVLIRLGLDERGLTTINDIATSFGVSKNHLMKIVNELGRKGYLETVRGRNGGIRLKRPPRDINIGEVVRDTEDELDILGCLRETGYCRIEQVCVLRSVVREATTAFLAVFDGYTLSDLLEPRQALAALLLDPRASPATR